MVQFCDCVQCTVPFLTALRLSKICHNNVICYFVSCLPSTCKELDVQMMAKNSERQWSKFQTGSQIQYISSGTFINFSQKTLNSEKKSLK